MFGLLEPMLCKASMPGAEHVLLLWGKHSHLLLFHELWAKEQLSFSYSEAYYATYLVFAGM